MQLFTPTSSNQASRSQPCLSASGRRIRGFSLITVAALGAVSMMWLFAMSASVLPMYQRASQGRYLTVVRSSAEAGLDYAVAMLNQALQAEVPAAIDDGSNDGSPVVSTVPLSALGNSGAQVTIAVNNTDPPNNSSIYDPQWDPDQTGAPNGWRVVTATASYAGLQKSIRVILKPESAGLINQPSRVPYFRYAMFGKSLIQMSGNAYTDSYNSVNGAYGGFNVNAYGGDVGSNTRAVLGGNSTVGGDLRIYSLPPGSTTAVVAQASGNAVVKDQLITNGVSSGFTGTPDLPSPLPGDNVLAQGQSPAPRTGEYLSPIDASQSFAQIETPPALSVPANSQVVTGNMTWDGSTGWVGQPGAGQVADLGSVSVSGNNTLNIRPGDYKISSFSVSGNGRINVKPNANGTFGPVRFFVEGIAPGSNVIQISGNGVVNESIVPSNLQFWYNGSKNIQLSGNGSLHSLVYAPNSIVKVSGNGTYFGAMLGERVENSGNGAVHFDDALLAQTGALTFGVNQVQAPPSSLKTRSWQEL